MIQQLTYDVIIHVLQENVKLKALIAKQKKQSNTGNMENSVVVANGKI